MIIAKPITTIKHRTQEVEDEAILGSWELFASDGSWEENDPNSNELISELLHTDHRPYSICVNEYRLFIGYDRSGFCFLYRRMIIVEE